MLWPILRTALRQPRHVAVIDDRRKWRYLDIVGGAFALAEKLLAVSSSQNVGILLPTSGAFPMALLATWMLGRTAVPVNYLLSPQERQFIIDDSGIDTLITLGPMLDLLGERPRGVKLLQLEQLNFNAVPPLRWPSLRGGDQTAVILYTSGTSGRPKGVMLTHANLRYDVDAAIGHVGLTAADSFLGVLPQFHSFGLTGLTLVPLVLGATVIYTARFVPHKIVSLIRVHRPHLVMFIPSMYAALLTAKNAKAEDFTSIRLAVSGGEPLPRDVAQKFESRFGVKLHEGYGLTETSPILAINAVNRFREGSVGTVLEGLEAIVVDERDRVLPADAEGELLFRGPAIMKGYYNQPQLTEQVLTPECFFRTGDWGRIDRDGFVFITGRKKEMLIIGGENVFPREIEEVLNRHPSIGTSAVIGRQDPLRGEVPVAFVELAEGATFEEDAVRAFCREHLAGFKIPRDIYVICPLPRNPTGKILRRELVAKLAEIDGGPAAGA